ncbi:hypothetical protein [Stenotrophomonas sp. TWI587]|jgi:hypothetical protein|uniref:hypothetical protein n=1 Tax=unclassified Stenotrophomonas TaxID=196198 RepID=UPI0032097EC7
MAGKKRRWAAMVGLGRMTDREYRANMNGLNMFFGAVLGLALTGAEQLNDLRFAVVLTMVAGAVISILYISSSRHRAAYAAYAVLVSATFPELVGVLFHDPDIVPDKIRPTLLVWAGMTILVEFWQREKEAPAAGPAGPAGADPGA